MGLFLIHSPPDVVTFIVDFHKNLVRMPLPIGISVHPTYPALADFGREHRAKSVPPKPDSFVANVDAPFVQQIFHIAKLKRDPDIHHHRQMDDLGGCFEMAKWVWFSHAPTLEKRPTRLKPVSSDCTKLLSVYTSGRCSASFLLKSISNSPNRRSSCRAK